MNEDMDDDCEKSCGCEENEHCPECCNNSGVYSPGTECDLCRWDCEEIEFHDSNEIVVECNEDGLPF